MKAICRKWWRWREIEPAPPKGLQIYDIIRYNYTSKIANGTGVMGQ